MNDREEFWKDEPWNRGLRLHTKDLAVKSANTGGSCKLFSLPQTALKVCIVKVFSCLCSLYHPLPGMDD